MSLNFDKHAYLLTAIDRLHAKGSWTGKTHVQKTLALASLVADVPFAFILYKHGPYSFEVDDEIEQMEGYGAVAVVPAPMGVRIETGEGRQFVAARAHPDPKLVAAVERAAEFAGSKGVADLEAEATAAWIIRREGVSGDEAVADRLHALKPHIDIVRAAAAAVSARGFFASVAP